MSQKELGWKGWFNSGVVAQPKVQPANSHYPIAFPIRTSRYKIILKSYKTQKHNSVIEERTKLFLRFHDRKEVTGQSG